MSNSVNPFREETIDPDKAILLTSMLLSVLLGILLSIFFPMDDTRFLRERRQQQQQQMRVTFRVIRNRSNLKAAA